MKTLTPCYQIRPQQRALSINKGRRHFFFLKERASISAVPCCSLSSVFPPTPVLIPSFAFICLSCRQQAWPEIKTLSCLFARCQHKAFPIVSHSTGAFWKMFFWWQGCHPLGTKPPLIKQMYPTDFNYGFWKARISVWDLKSKFAGILWVCGPNSRVKHTFRAKVFDPGVSEVLILQHVKGRVESDEWIALIALFKLCFYTDGTLHRTISFNSLLE